jgi:hypothetical protein
MSVTTTANPTTQTVLHLLADYNLTHSEDHQHSANVESPDFDYDRQAPVAQNPDWWPDNYDGIPRYRPINYGLNREERPWANPGIECAFVYVMLNGVGLIAVRLQIL